MTRLRVVMAAALALLGAAACTRSPVHHQVEMRALRFEPREILIARGDTISWINRDIVPHTATASDSAWNSAVVTPGGEFRVVPSRRGTLRYACAYHPDMTGRITVQ